VSGVQCMNCYVVFTLDEVAALSSCPNCHTRVPAMSTENVVELKVNIEELRLVCAWAEMWADRGELPEELVAVFQAIKRRLLTPPAETNFPLIAMVNRSFEVVPLELS